MIKSFKHKDLENFYNVASTKGIPESRAERISRILSVLDNLVGLKDLSSPGYDLRPLNDKTKNQWSVRVQDTWRISFKYNEKTNEVFDLNYKDFQ